MNSQVIVSKMEKAICKKHKCSSKNIDRTSGLELGTTYEKGQDFEMYYKLKSDLSEDPWTGCVFWSAAEKKAY